MKQVNLNAGIGVAIKEYLTDVGTTDYAKNLGEQAEQEFMSFVPNDDNRKFREL